MKIELGKTYVNGRGEKFRIVSLDGLKGEEVIGVCDDPGFVRSFSLSGGFEHDYWSLVEEYNPWNDVKVDTPIWGRDINVDEWLPRHFAMYFNGKVYAWSNGATSHSSGYTIGEKMDNFVTYWEQTTLINPNKTKG